MNICLNSQIKKYKIINDKISYYESVLISLGLSNKYVLIKNYEYFGFKDISNQEKIKRIIEKVEKNLKKI